MNHGEYYPTRHVVEKMNARNITWAEILEIVEKPEVTFGPDTRGRKVLQKDDLAVVVGSDNAIVTVLLRDEDQWTDEDARKRVRSPQHVGSPHGLQTEANDVFILRLDQMIWDIFCEKRSLTRLEVFQEVEAIYPSRYPASAIGRRLNRYVDAGKLKKSYHPSSPATYHIVD